MRLGISSYTYVWSVGVPGFPQPARPLTAMQLVERSAELGVYVLQIADNLPLDRLTMKELDELLRVAREREVDLEVGTWGVEPAQLKTYLGVAQRLGSPIVRTIIDAKDWPKGRNETVAAIKSALPDFSEAGVTLAIENHDRIPAADLAEILKQCESQFVGVCLDTANSIGCGEDLHTVLRLLAPWVVNVHYKDFVGRRLPHNKGFVIEGCPAGDGLVSLSTLVRGLGERSENASVIVELWPPPEATIEESMAKEEAWARQSVDYLRQFIIV
jgi:sugar phosphate isomerase/epimerase